jgi:replicative DNA helicase
VTSIAPAPPHHQEAEENLIGAVLYSPTVLGNVGDAVNPADFYRHSHGAIWQAFLEMDAHGVGIDWITVSDWLDEHGMLEKAGGRDRLRDLACLVPSTANVAHWAQIVAEMSFLRGAIVGGSEISRIGWDRPGDVENLKDRIEQIAFGITQKAFRTDLELLAPAAHDAYQRVERLANSDGQVIGLSTGFPSVDKILGGIEPGNLVVLAARPSMGKTAMAMSFVAKLAIRERKPVGVFLLEASRFEMAMRLQSSGSLIPIERLRSGDIRDDEWPKLQHATAQIEQAPIHVDDESTVTLAEIRSKARRLKMREPDLALIIVDYLQLMSAEGQNRNEQVSALSRGMKVLARQLDVPILCLAQLNRQLEMRGDKRPILSDLRDSGAIEQDADTIIFLYREDYYRPHSERRDNTAEVIVAKNRMGPTDTARLSFHPGQAKFQEHAA